METRLDLEDILSGLQQLADEIERRGLSDVTIRIVGGAALRIAYFDRATTVDIDAEIRPMDEVQPLITQIAEGRGWPTNWLNDGVKRAGFMPVWGQQAEWTPVIRNDAVSIDVASIEVLLAMKLNAHAGRAGRDGQDIVRILALTDIRTVEEAEKVLERYFPGDGISVRTAEFLEGVFRKGLPNLS